MKVKKESKNKLSPLTIALFTVLAIYVVFLLVVFVWVFLTASKDYYMDYRPLKGEPNLAGFPKEFKLFYNISLINKCFAGFTLIEMAIYTLLYALGCSLAKVVVTCVVSYLCSRYENFFSKIIYIVVIVTMIIPVVGNQAAEIQLARELNFHDSILGMWIMRANFLGMYFLVFYSVFKSMPKGYYEAARIDGANDWQVMVKIALPLVKYTFFSIFLILFIEYWNDYLIPNYYLPSYKTLSLALHQQSGSQYLAPVKVLINGTELEMTLDKDTYVMATTLCVTIPVIAIFAIFSKKLMGNLSVGGLKG